MLKIVVINSTGPMASTVVGSVVEKFGALNIPLRKLGLHEYLYGTRNLDDGFFLKKFLSAVDGHGILIRSGGVNVKDRNSSAPKKLIDSLKVKESIDRKFIDEITTISELYDYVRGLYASSLLYKDNRYESGFHIEYTTDISKYDVKKLNHLYKKEFSEVFFINLHREFLDWLDSLLSQKFIHPKAKVRYLFIFGRFKRQYTQYEDAIRNQEGLHLEFNELFIPNTPNLVERLSKYLQINSPEIDWTRQDYDLYGKLVEYESAFTIADGGYKYLSKPTLFLADFLFKRKIYIHVVYDLIIYPFILFDSIRFQIKNSKIIKTK